jgi:hypothetical protein
MRGVRVVLEPAEANGDLDPRAVMSGPIGDGRIPSGPRRAFRRVCAEALHRWITVSVAVS